MAMDFELPALQRIAKIVSRIYNEEEIIDLFDKAGIGISLHYYRKMKSLYTSLRKIQLQHGGERIIIFLEAVCNPQEYIGKDELFAAIRNDVNMVLKFYSRTMDENGVVQHRIDWKIPTSPQNEKEKLFQRRSLHRYVVEHSKKDFIRGEYSSAVFECCKAFETLVRERSGIQEKTGADLMLAAFSEKNPALKITMSSVSQQTRTNMQKGLMQLCAGLMSGIRNPVGHETKTNLPIEIDEALDILTLISYLVQRVERCESTGL